MTTRCVLARYTLDCCDGAGPSTPYTTPRTTPSPPQYPPSHPPKYNPSNQSLECNPLDPLDSPIGHVNELMKTTSNTIMGLQARLTHLEELVTARSGLCMKSMENVYVELAAYEDSDVSACLDRIERDLWALFVKGKCPGQWVFEAYNFVCVQVQHLFAVRVGIHDLKQRVLAMLEHAAGTGPDVPSLAHQLQKEGHPLKNSGYNMGEYNMWGSDTRKPSMMIQYSEDKGEYYDTYDTTMADLKNTTQMRANAKGKGIER